MLEEIADKSEISEVSFPKTKKTCLFLVMYTNNYENDAIFDSQACFALNFIRRGCVCEESQLICLLET